MAQYPLYPQADNWLATLNTTMTDVTTSCVLASSGATGAPDVPFIMDCDAEDMLCTAITEDTPSSGLDTLTVTRGYNGTTAAAHTAGARVQQRIYAKQFNDLNRDVAALKMVMADSFGGGEGVIRTSTETQLKVTAQGSPNMTVNVAIGGAIVDGQVAAITTAVNTSAIVAPVTNPRIDVIQIDKDGNIEVKTGTEAGSPSAPAVDADALKLAEIALATSTTSIITGLITDSRVFL